MEKLINEYLDKLENKIENYWYDLKGTIDEKNLVQNISDLKLDYDLIFDKQTLKLKVNVKYKIEYLNDYNEMDEQSFDLTKYYDDFDITSISIYVLNELEDFIYSKQQWNCERYDEDER